MNDDEVVYDSEFGDLRGGGKKKDGKKRNKNRSSGRSSGAKSTSGPEDQAAKDGKVRVVREKKGRGGKLVTVIYGLSLPEEKMEQLAKELKKRCGAGGTVKGETVEVQGDNTESVMAVLEQRGIKAVRAGG